MVMNQTEYIVYFNDLIKSVLVKADSFADAWNMASKIAYGANADLPKPRAYVRDGGNSREIVRQDNESIVLGKVSLAKPNNTTSSKAQSTSEKQIEKKPKKRISPLIIALIVILCVSLTYLISTANNPKGTPLTSDEVVFTEDGYLDLDSVDTIFNERFTGDPGDFTTYTDKQLKEAYYFHKEEIDFIMQDAPDNYLESYPLEMEYHTGELEKIMKELKNRGLKIDPETGRIQ